MGIFVYSLLSVMQDLYHQPYHNNGSPYSSAMLVLTPMRTHVLMIFSLGTSPIISVRVTTLNPKT